MEKLIISAAICGAEVTKEQNPAVPYTVEEIAREAKSAYDAGASVIHLHVRWDDGTPTQDKGRFQECVDAIRALCPEAIIQPSTGGAVGMSDLERLQPTEIEPTPEFATLDCGTCNFGGDEIFVNTDNTVMNFAKIMAERGIKPELEVFDKGMIDIALKADRKGLLKHPLHFDFVLGVQMSATVRVSASSAPKASSSSNMSGDCAIARANPARCAMPPESSFGKASAASQSRTAFSASSVRPHFSEPGSSRTASDTFSRTVIQGKSRGS